MSACQTVPMPASIIVPTLMDPIVVAATVALGSTVMMERIVQVSIQCLARLHNLL